MKILLSIVVASAAISVAWFWPIREDTPKVTWEQSVTIENPIAVAPLRIPDEPVVPEVEPELPESITHVVPFTSQAPSAQWSDPVFQNACEEASILMAAAWARNEETLPEKTVVELGIRSISADAEKRFGENAYDTSAEDTATLFREYSKVEANVRHDVTRDDVTNAIRRGNIVIAPFDGRKLGNPNYTPPGPVYHMLVIIGYDAETGEFVTNDPGTRRGASYRYDEAVLFDAIRDYGTGYHLKTTDIPQKNIIVIPRTEKSEKD